MAEAKVEQWMRDAATDCIRAAYLNQFISTHYKTVEIVAGWIAVHAPQPQQAEAPTRLSPAQAWGLAKIKDILKEPVYDEDAAPVRDVEAPIYAAADYGFDPPVIVRDVEELRRESQVKIDNLRDLNTPQGELLRGLLECVVIDDGDIVPRYAFTLQASGLVDDYFNLAAKAASGGRGHVGHGSGEGAVVARLDACPPSVSQDELNRAYRFMHAWLIRANPAYANPRQKIRMTRNRLANILAEFLAGSQNAAAPKEGQ